MKKIGGFTTPFTDAVVTPPSAKSGAGSFGDSAGSQKPTESPIKPVLFADVDGGAAGSHGFGGGKDIPTKLKG